MAFKVKRDGAWTTPASGTVKVKNAGAWQTVISIKEKVNGVWVDSGYAGLPGTPQNLVTSSAGDGDTKTMSFSWTAPASGAPVSGYRMKVYSNSSPTTLIATLPSATTTYPSPANTVNFGNSPYSATSGSQYQIEVVAVGTTGLESSPTPRKRVTIGAPSSSTPVYGYMSSVGWATAGTPSGSTYWNSYERPASNMTDGNIFTIWSSNARYNSAATDSYQGIVVSSYGAPIGLDPYFNKPRKLHGIRLWTNHRGWFWAGYAIYGETGWQGADVLAGVTGETAGFANQSYIGHYEGREPWIDGWTYIDYAASFGFSPEDAIGAKLDLYKITFGPYLPYNDEAAAGGNPYRVDVNEVQIGFRSWGQTGTSTTAATANTLVSV